MSSEIIEGNRLIAEFMGLLSGKTQYPFTKPNESVNYRVSQYHTSWDWLMPVVEKISLIPFPKDKGWKDEDYKDFSAYPYPRTFGMRNTEGKFMVRLNASQLFEADTLIEATWLAVVDFITWYNQSKQG